MGSIAINGVTYSGNSVSVINGTVIIDGVVQGREKLSGVVEVRIIEGEILDLRSDASITCGKVKGNVNAGGSVTCDDVGGSVNAGGSVRAGNVGGTVMAGGSVRHG